MWNLHRVGQKADWETIPAKKRNPWQQLAAATRGVVTPANVASLVGAGIAGWGLWQLYQGELRWGLALIAVGRFIDLVDGALADITGTKSSVGEAIDAGLDKLVLVGALLVFIAIGALPILAIALIGLRNIATITLSLLAKAHHKTLHPSRAGKFASAVEWTAILGFILAVVFDHYNLASLSISAVIVAYILLAGALLLGVVALKDYWRALKPATV